MTVELTNLQTIAQFGAGLTFLSMGVITFFYERTNNIVGVCRKEISRAEGLVNCSIPGDVRRLLLLTAKLRSIEWWIISFKELNDRIVTWPSAIFISVLPAIMYIIVLSLYPFFPEYQFRGIGVVLAVVVAVGWLPACLVILLAFVCLTIFEFRVRKVVSKIEKVIQDS